MWRCETSTEQAFSRNRGFSAKNAGEQRTQNPKVIPLYFRHIQNQLGHSSPTTTANLYADISFTDMQAGVTGLYVASGS
jgi:integrase